MEPTSESFSKLEAAFHKARELTGPDRANFLAELFATEPALARELSTMLEADSEGESFGYHRPRRGTGAANVPTLSEGTMLGPFRVLRPIGSGGMGTVYLAEQDRPARQVAIKVVRPGAAAWRARFELESDILAHLQHAGIAQVYAAGVEPLPSGETPWFAMELVLGAPITVAAQDRGLRVRERVSLMAKVCDAAAHAHQRGVIHRDLKPSNILLDASGQPKILDFGVARLTNSDGASATLDSTVGHIVGTLNTMSPEQARGDGRAIDTRSDVYGLGAVLFELLVGKPPLDLEGRSLMEALQRIREEVPPRLGSLRSELRGDIEAIVACALEKDQDRRYPTATAMADDLRRSLANQPIAARSTHRLYLASRFVRRHAAAVVAVALVFLSVVAALIVTAIERNRAAASAARADSEARAKSQALEKVQRLADQHRLDELLAQADRLWPAHPAQVAAYEQWQRDAKRVVDRRVLHETTLAEMRRTALPITPEFPDQVRFTDTETQWEHDLLARLMKTLERFEGDGGVIADIDRRRKSALELPLRTIVEPTVAWQECVRRVQANPSYRGIEFSPQLGLLPLGPDSESGFEEFLHWSSHEGPIPSRNSDGELRIPPKCGIVLVLLPGGDSWIGAQSRDPGGHRYDPEANDAQDSPVSLIPLRPFLVGKYEVSQAQWTTVMGRNPARHEANEHKPKPMIPLTVLHPVEMVSWHDCVEMLRRIGLVLPTEAQWEYAARGGKDTVWWTGNDRDSLIGAVNLADQASVRGGARFAHAADWPELDDGFILHAPIHTLIPNPFGLHHVYGNVCEWCLDGFTTYDQPFREGDGARYSSLGEVRVHRGGDHTDRAAATRSCKRSAGAPSTRVDRIGLRAAMSMTNKGGNSSVAPPR